jgi:hypothetical protein
MSDLSDSDSSLGEDELVFTVQEVLRTGLSILHYTKKKIRRAKEAVASEARLPSSSAAFFFAASGDFREGLLTAAILFLVFGVSAGKVTALFLLLLPAARVVITIAQSKMNIIRRGRNR